MSKTEIVMQTVGRMPLSVGFTNRDVRKLIFEHHREEVGKGEVSRVLKQMPCAPNTGTILVSRSTGDIEAKEYTRCEPNENLCDNCAHGPNGNATSCPITPYETLYREPKETEEPILITTNLDLDQSAAWALLALSAFENGDILSTSSLKSVTIKNGHFSPMRVIQLYGSLQPVLLDTAACTQQVTSSGQTKQYRRVFPVTKKGKIVCGACPFNPENIDEKDWQSTRCPIALKTSKTNK